jgi:GNAT superfamily N-acetyltransferase
VPTCRRSPRCTWATFNETHTVNNDGPTYELREHQWRSAFAKDDGSWFSIVIENEQGELIGFAKGTPHRGGVPGFEGELNKIYLLRRYHRQGLGRALLCFVPHRGLMIGMQRTHIGRTRRRRSRPRPAAERAALTSASGETEMMFRAVVLWVTGLLTIVPYGVYYLFVHAQPNQYAFLITLVLFWIFGYWGIAGPVLAAMRVRSVMRLIESAQSEGELREALRSEDAQEAAIDLIASENGLPRFLAVKVFRLLTKRLSAVQASAATSLPASTTGEAA